MSDTDWERAWQLHKAMEVERERLNQGRFANREKLARELLDLIDKFRHDIYEYYPIRLQPEMLDGLVDDLQPCLEKALKVIKEIRNWYISPEDWEKNGSDRYRPGSTK